MKRCEKLNIVYEDKYILVVNKPHNLLTIGTIKEKENTLYKKVSDYVKKQHKNNKIFIVHRLDKETSGLIVFAKNELVKKKLQDNWDKVVRKYIALVNGVIKEEGIIKNYLAEDITLRTYITNNKNIGKLSITKYKPIRQFKNKTLIEIEILTGRKNQIRVHMASINHPIVGDKKYGLKTKTNIMCLEAYYLEFNHPITKELLIIKTNPEMFTK